MKEKESSLFPTSFLLTTMLRSSRFVPAAGRAFVFLLQVHFSSPGLAPQAVRAKSLPCPGSSLAGCLCRGYMRAAPLLTQLPKAHVQVPSRIMWQRQMSPLLTDTEGNTTQVTVVQVSSSLPTLLLWHSLSNTEATELSLTPKMH